MCDEDLRFVFLLIYLFVSGLMLIRIESKCCFCRSPLFVGVISDIGSVVARKVYVLPNATTRGAAVGFVDGNVDFTHSALFLMEIFSSVFCSTLLGDQSVLPRHV